MKQLFAFIRKEFYHVFRDRRTLLILFGLPVVQIVLFGFALSSEVKNIGITLLDNAHDHDSEQIANRIKSSAYFLVKDPVMNYADIEKQFKEGKVKCALVFPINFGQELARSGKAQIQVIADGADPNTATILVNYLRAIIAGYQQQLNPSSFSLTIDTDVRAVQTIIKMRAITPGMKLSEPFCSSLYNCLISGII